MLHWKWNSGEPYYKSARVYKQYTNLDVNLDTEQNAIKQSLEENLFFKQDADLINVTNSMFSKNQHQSGTRREDIDLKMGDREMVAQRGFNPFMQTSYVNDIVSQEMFLKPQNTTHEKIKTKPNTE